jgi:hypothetical protein
VREETTTGGTFRARTTTRWTAKVSTVPWEIQLRANKHLSSLRGRHPRQRIGGRPCPSALARAPSSEHQSVAARSPDPRRRDYLRTRQAHPPTLPPAPRSRTRTVGVGPTRSAAADAPSGSANVLQAHSKNMLPRCRSIATPHALHMPSRVKLIVVRITGNKIVLKLSCASADSIPGSQGAAGHTRGGLTRAGDRQQQGAP